MATALTNRSTRVTSSPSTAARLGLSTGDSATVACTGPGTVWTATVDPAQSSACSHTYTRVPPSGVSTLRATVTWSVAWTGAGVTGTGPTLTTTAAIDLLVRDAGALNSIGGHR